jgi:chlorobactene glucosyltransferase
MLIHYQLAITGIMVYILLTTLYNLRHMLRLPSLDSLPWPPPLVSVLVPARDEARNIRACLESLLQQDYPNLEIIVLDDDSSDETPEIVRELAAQHPKIRLITGQPLPPNWHGKAWACQQLSQQARGEWLLFVDADTRLRSDCVSAALAVAWANGLDLVSLLPNMALKTFGERVIMAVIPFVFIACVPHFMFTWTRYPGLVAAIGPFMLFRRETYQKFGGHEAVRRDIVEDVMIARWVKRVGGKVALVDGIATLRVEFYQGFREAWHGLSKSAFPAFDYSLLGMLLALAAFALVFLGPYLFLYGAWRDGLRDLAHFWLPLAQVSLAWLAMWLINGRILIPRPYALLLGLTVLVAMLFSLHSVWSHLVGPGTVWKGRTYQFKGRAQNGGL